MLVWLHADVTVAVASDRRRPDVCVAYLSGIRLE